jgi:hypothetical protein
LGWLLSSFACGDPLSFLFSLPLLLATHAKVYVFVTKDLDWSEMTLFLLFLWLLFNFIHYILSFVAWLHYS